MSNIYVDQLNFEYPETPNYHDILKVQGDGTQSLSETIHTPSHIYVDIINLEIPVGVGNIEVFTNTQTSTQFLIEAEAGQETCEEHGSQTIEEVITGAPVPEPEVAVGGGAGQRIRVMGGRPWSEEDIYVTNRAEVVISEEILVGELVYAYSNNVPTLDTRIRKPVYATPRRVEILSFTPRPDRAVQIPMEEPKINSRRREEEELILLGII